MRRCPSVPGPPCWGGLRIGAIVPAYNEADLLNRLMPAIPKDLVDVVVIVKDGSTDGTSAAARGHGACVIDHGDRTGTGPAIRDGLDLLRSQGFDAIAVMVANGKHDPGMTRGRGPRPGARLSLPGRGSLVNMPWHRLCLIRLFTVLTKLVVGQRVTDAPEASLLGGYRSKEVPVCATYPESGPYTRSRALVDGGATLAAWCSCGSASGAGQG